MSVKDEPQGTQNWGYHPFPLQALKRCVQRQPDVVQCKYLDPINFLFTAADVCGSERNVQAQCVHRGRRTTRDVCTLTIAVVYTRSARNRVELFRQPMADSQSPPFNYAARPSHSSIAVHI
jgi:hypothetical protein